MAKNQMEIPGTEGPVIKEIETKAENYVAARDKRMAYLVKEMAAQAELLAAMRKHEEKIRNPDGSLLYQFDGRVVSLQMSEKVKVKSVAEEDE